MRDFLSRLFRRERPPATRCTEADCATREDDDAREREKQEIADRLHSATNRLHYLEWQADVESRRLKDSNR